jgi:hypothetical protein
MPFHCAHRMATIPEEWANAATNMSVISGAIDVPVRSGRLTARSELVTARPWSTTRTFLSLIYEAHAMVVGLRPESAFRAAPRRLTRNRDFDQCFRAVSALCERRSALAPRLLYRSACG